MTAVMSPSSQALAQSLPSPSNFEAYARAVQCLPFLSEQRELELATTWKNHQDKSAAWELVMAHLRLVVRVVRDQAGYGLSAGDLAQEGTVGLMKAVHRFDPARGIRLAAYAIKWIEAEVREYIMRNWRLVRLGSGAAMKKLFFGYRQAVSSLRHWGEERDVAPTIEALAQELNLSPAQVAHARAYFGGKDMSLESEVDDQRSREERPGLQSVFFQAPRGHDPAWQAETDDLTEHRSTAMGQALATLTPRDRDILQARHLQDTPMGLVELGQRHGVSAERVRQLEKRALSLVRIHMGEALAP